MLYFESHEGGGEAGAADEAADAADEDSDHGSALLDAEDEQRGLAAAEFDLEMDPFEAAAGLAAMSRPPRPPQAPRAQPGAAQPFGGGRQPVISEDARGFVYAAGRQEPLGRITSWGVQISARFCSN